MRVFNAARDLILPSTITGSYPRPHWFTEELRGRGLVNRHYAADRDLILALAGVFNAELRAIAAAGCRVIQVEEPQHHIAGANGTATDSDLEFFTEAVNREIEGVDTEIWLHTCWGNPDQQPLHWERPSYERALPTCSGPTPT